MSQLTSVSVIGPGSLGTAIIDLIVAHSNFSLTSVWGRKSTDSYFFLPGGDKRSAKKAFPSDEPDLGELIIISVPDNKISKIAHRLTDVPISWNQRSVVHTSGSLDSSVLSPLADAGAKTASMHPLQTFTKGDSYERFKNIWVSLQGDESLFPVLRSLVEPFGAYTRVLDSEQKSAMHLSAVFASNYLVSLMKIVEEIANDSGIDDGLEMLEPIIRQTLENISERGPDHSLSGPVARGDTQTIQKHLNQLKSSPNKEQLYRRLGMIAADIAGKKSGTSKLGIEEVKKELASGLSSDE